MASESELVALHRHARHGWFWGVIDQVAQRGLSMIVSLVLARLLDPSAFGIIASVTIFLSVTQQIIDGGIAQRIIQKVDVEEEDYCALFWCSWFVALLCCSLLVVFSGSIARFYDNPQLKLVVVALALNLLLMNAGRVQATRLARDLRFKTASLIRIGSVIAGCGVGLSLAFYKFGVWAIIGQQLITSATMAGVFWIVVPWKPSKWPSVKAIKDLYGYGLPVAFSQTMRTVASQLINVLIAKTVSASALGYYDRGRIIPQNLGFSLERIFRRTNFPVLARLQGDEVAFRETYLKFLGITSATYFMVMTGLAVCAQDVIIVLLGVKWLPSVWFVQCNCIAFSIQVLFLANTELFRSKGKTGLYFRYTMICAVLQIIGVVLGIPWGAKGMVVGDIMARVLACLPLIMAVSKISQVTVQSQLIGLVRPFLGSGIVAVGLLLIRSAGLSLWPRFLLSGLSGAALIFIYWKTSGFRFFADKK